MVREVHQRRNELRLFSLAALAIIAMALVLLVLLLVPGAVDGSIVGDQPPSSGDWHVQNDTTVTGETITIDGDLILEARLDLRESVIVLDPSGPGTIGINVTDLGVLDARNTTFKSSTGVPYFFHVNGEMLLGDCTVEDAFWGIQVRTDERVRIYDVLITDIFGRALLLETDDAYVRGLRVYDDGFRSRSNRTVVTDTVDGFVEYAESLPSLIVLSGGTFGLDDIDISLNGTLEHYVQFYQNTADGGLDIDLGWHVFDVDTKENVRFRNVRFRESHIDLYCEVTQGQTVPRTISVDVTFGYDTFVLRNYRDVTIEGLEMRAVEPPYININLTSALPGVDLSNSSEDRGIRAVHAYVDEVFTTAGPHKFRLDIADFSLGANGLLLHRLEPGYSGTVSPTFQQVLDVENVTVGRTETPVLMVLSPTFPLMKTFDVDVRFRASTFSGTLGAVADFAYWTGPTTPYYRSISLTERTSFEDCTFQSTVPGNHGIIKVSTNIHEEHLFDSELVVSECRFIGNVGTWLNINGSTCKARDRLVLVNNTFSINTCRDNQRLAYVVLRSEIVMTGNSFFDNQGTNGMFLYDPGVQPQGKYPCNFNIINNSFDGNMIHEHGELPRAFMDIMWGGDLNVSRNVIKGTGSLFLNVSDYSGGSMGSTLSFVDNMVTDNDLAVLYFTNNRRDHQDLYVLIRNNTVWDQRGALVDYLFESEFLLLNDWGATFDILDNNVSNLRSTVITLYGNITVSGNTFTDCVGWVLRFEHLRVHRPYLLNNTFVDCGDAVMFRAKAQAVRPVLLWMDNNQIDTNGTALHFFYMEVTLRTTTVTGTPNRAVVAEISYVDAYDCTFERDDCEVLVDGYIRMWYWVEAWVRWASKDGMATGNPVVDANVTFIDQAGMPSQTVYSDGEGHLVPFGVMAWHIEHSTEPTEMNPYTIVVSLSSFRTSIEMTINSSHRGDAALELLLLDPEDPFVSIDAPEDGSAHNTLSLEVAGFATDKGSGVHTLTVTLGAGAPQFATPDPDGSYLHVLEDAPEGTWDLVVAVSDAGGNSMVVSITLEVDRTAPRLVVTHPKEDLHTNTTTVNLRGEVETGAELMVNMLEVATLTGAFDLELSLNEGANYFGLAATDRAGNTASVVIWVTRDTIDPGLELYGPVDGLEVNHTDVTVWGLVEECDAVTLTLHRVSTDIVDRPIHPGEDGRFEVLAELEEGVNEIVVTARDLAGNSVTLRRTVIMDATPPSLELLSPQHDTLLNVRQVTVVFTVSTDADQVYVNGKRVLGTGELDTTIMLGEGENPITLVALDRLNNRVITSIIVHVDTVAPTLELTSPNVTSFKTNDPAVEVRGVVGDGDLNGITVTVDENPATVTTDGKFFYLLTLDEDGTHQVDVVAHDRAGNIARTAFNVDLLTEAPLMSLHFSPADDRVDPGTDLYIQGASARTPLTVTIVHDAAGDRREYTFLMINASFEHYLELVKGVNTVTVRSVDEYGNRNVTTPHVVDVREVQEQEPSDPNTLYLIAAVVVAVALIVVAYIILRRP